MEPRVVKLAQLIAKIQSVYTDHEIAEAFDLLERASSDDMRELLRKRRTPVASRKVPLSQELERFKETDPQTSEIIELFRRGLESGALLPTLSEMRSFGVSLDKDFRPAKSRTETIPRLVRLLLRIPRADLHRIVETVPSNESAGSEAFLRLAEGIIRGRDRHKDRGVEP